MLEYGTRKEVMKGTALMTCKTKGTLTRADLIKRKNGKIVSHKKSASAKKHNNNKTFLLMNEARLIVSKGRDEDNAADKKYLAGLFTKNSAINRDRSKVYQQLKAERG